MNDTSQSKIIAVFGSTGSFSEQAAISKYGKKNVEYKYFEDLFSLLNYLQNNKAVIGVIPFSNNNVGHVEMTQNLLANYQYKILGKIKYGVDLYLFAKKGVSKKMIRKVASHPHALLQCTRYIAENLNDATVISAISTSHAAMYLAHNKFDDDTAVIASKEAGEQFELAELGRKIQDKKSNYTDFLILKVE